MSSLNEIENPQFDILSVASIDSSVANTIFRKYEPDVSLTPTSTQVIINVRDLREYMNLANSYLEIRGQFSGSATAYDTVIPTTARPALECGATSLFNQSRLRVNQVLVEDNFSTSHFNAFIKQLTSQSKDYADTIGRNSGFIPDRAYGTADEVETNYATKNAGYIERRLDAHGKFNDVAYTVNQVAINKSYTVRLSDLFSFCNVNKVIKGTTLRIELNLRTPAERMFSAVTGAFYLIKNINLYLAVVEPSLEMQAKLEGILASPVSMAYNYINYKTYQSDTLNTVSRSFTFSIQSQKPLGAFVYAQRSSSAATEDLFNSMVFDSALTNFVQMRVNNKLYPYVPYEPVFNKSSTGSEDITQIAYASSLCSREYEEFIKFMSRNYNVDSGCLITLKEWENCFPIYFVPFYNLPDATSYQLTLDTRASAALSANSTVGNRGQSTTWYLTLMTLAEVQVKSDGQGMQIFAM